MHRYLTVIMKVHVFDFRWSESEPHQFGCEIQAGRGNKFGRKKLWIGDDISIEIASDSRCAGFRDETMKWKPCPKQSVGKPKCDFCRSMEGSFVYTAFDGFDTSQLNDQDLQKISGEHWVYLAFFANNLIKIGVTKANRKRLRQVEQGSYATLYVAKTPDGIAARQIETLIRKGGLADKIKVSQKKDFLCPIVRDPELQLQETLKNARQHLSEHEHLEAFLLANPEYHCWQTTYSLADFEGTIQNVKLNVGEWVSGKIIAFKGPFALIQTPYEFVNIAMKSLRGKDINFTAREHGLRLNSALQGSLF
jgi:hypothetical protein